MESEDGGGWPAWQEDVGYGGLAILPPPEIARILDPIRQGLDPVAAVLGAHINLILGFAGRPSRADLVRLEVLHGTIEPITIQLGPPTRFNNSSVVYLTVEPRDELERLRTELLATGLFLLDLPYSDDFVPHLTLSVAADAAAAALLVALPGPEAMVFRCATIAWFVSDQEERYTVRRTFALGGAGIGGLGR